MNNPAAPTEQSQLGSPTYPADPLKDIYDNAPLPVFHPAPSVQAEINVVNKAIAEGRDAGAALEEWRKKNG